MILDSRTRRFLWFELNKTSVPIPWICLVCQNYHIRALLRSLKVLHALLKHFPETCYGVGTNIRDAVTHSAMNALVLFGLATMVAADDRYGTFTP